MSLIRYSHDNNRKMPYAKVYTIHPNFKDLYPDITFNHIHGWLKERVGSGAYEGKFFEMSDWGSISFHHHVLKRAKVNYTDLVQDLNGWGSAFKSEPKVEVFRPHKEVCMEMFGESKVRVEQECFATDFNPQMTGEEVIALYDLEGLSSEVLDNLFKLSDEEHHRVLDAIKRIRREGITS